MTIAHLKLLGTAGAERASRRSLSRAQAALALAGWVTLLAVAMPPSAGAAGFPTSSRTATEVQAAWPSYAPSFSGDPYVTIPSVVAPYATGAVNAGFLTDGLRVINFARLLAGLPADIALDPERTLEAQHGAVLLAASSFSHTPPRPADMSAAFFNVGYRSTSSSNIGWGYRSAFECELGFLDDDDLGNIDRVGHRRWLLNPEMLFTGIGFAGGRHTTYSFDRSRSGAVDYGFVAWPSAGAFPVQFFGDRVPWSISLNPSRYDLDRGGARRVTLRRVSDGRTWTFDASDTDRSREYFNTDFSGYGVPNCVIFRPDPASIDYRSGDEFDVTLSGGIFSRGTRDAVTISYRTSFVSLHPRDAFEPDNTRAQAATLAPDVRQSRTLDNPDDVDWLALDAHAGQKLAFELNVVKGARPPSLDIVNSAGTSVESLSAPREADEWRPPETGRYYLRVRGVLGRLDNLGYSIRLSAPASDVIQVPVRALLTPPRARTTPYRGKPVAFFGYLKPRHTQGTAVVEIRFYHHEDGKWIRRRTLKATARNHLDHSMYSASVTLPRSGRWRVRAYHSDSLHAPTSSALREFTVR